MNESLRVAHLCVEVYSGRVLHIILDQIIGSGYARWSEIATHDVSIWISGVPDRDVAICIEDAMVVKDVVCCDELAFQLGGLSVRSVNREVLAELTSARLTVAVGSWAHVSKRGLKGNGLSMPLLTSRYRVRRLRGLFSKSEAQRGMKHALPFPYCTSP